MQNRDDFLRRAKELTERAGAAGDEETKLLCARAAEQLHKLAEIETWRGEAGQGGAGLGAAGLGGAGRGRARRGIARRGVARQGFNDQKMTPEPQFKSGDKVFLNGDIPAVVCLSINNGTSLALSFAAVIDGYIGFMPVEFAGGKYSEYRAIGTNNRVTIIPRKVGQ